MGSSMIVELTAGAILANVLKGIALLTAVWVLARVLHRAPAAWRHVLWMAGLAAVLMLPLASYVAPTIEVPVAWARALPAPPLARVQTPALPAVTNAPAPGIVQHTAPAIALAVPETGESLESTPIAAPQPQILPSTMESAPKVAAAVAPPAPKAVNWPWVMCCAWVLAVAALLAPYGIGRAILWRLCRSGQDLRDDTWQTMLRETCVQLGIRRRIRLVASSRAIVPMTWGVLRPVVLLPAKAESWDDARKRMVLAHELAHVRRCDCLSDAFARLVRAFYWFNPLVWLALRRLHAEREAACDAWVLRLGHAPSAYAEALVHIAQDLRHPRLLQAAGLAMARSSQIKGRVRQILLPATGSTRSYVRMSIAVAIAFVLVCGALAMVRIHAAPRSVPQPGVMFKISDASDMSNPPGNASAPQDDSLRIYIAPGDDIDGFPKVTLDNLPFDAFRESGIDATTFQVRDKIVFGLELTSANDLAPVLAAAATKVEAVTIVVGTAEIPVRAVMQVMDALERAGIDNVQVRGEGLPFGGAARVVNGAPGAGGMRGVAGGFSSEAGLGGISWSERSEGRRTRGARRAAPGWSEQALNSAKDLLESVAEGVSSAMAGPEEKARAHVQNMLKQMGLVFKMYAGEAKGQRFPVRSEKPGEFQPQIDLIYPEYMADIALRDFVTNTTGDTVVYTGYTMQDEDDGMAFLKAYRAGKIGEDLNLGNRNLYMLREGVERFYITDINNPAGAAMAQSQIPIMWVMPGTPGGGNVLFMDGHVEYIEYPGKFPMTEKFIEGLREVAKVGQTSAPPGAASQPNQDAVERAKEQNKLKQMGLVFKMFANEAKGGAFPLRSNEPGVFQPELPSIYPEYVVDKNIVDFITGKQGKQVVYTGYALTDEARGLAFLDTYRSKGGEAIRETDVTADNMELLNLREGVERFFITDINDPAASAKAQASIPIMWTMPGTLGGGNVLFMDGHVEYIEYPGKFPMTEKFITGLERVLGKQSGSAQRDDAATQLLKRMGVLLKTYADEHGGELPRSVSAEGIFVPEPSEVFPEGATEAALVNFITGKYGGRVVYTGYALPDAKAGKAFLTACNEIGVNALAGAIETGGQRIYPLQEDVWNDPGATNDPQHDVATHATMPVMWTMPDDGKGGHVLFRDGSVEYVPYPGPFPMTPEFIQGIDTVLRRPIMEHSNVFTGELPEKHDEKLQSTSPPEILPDTTP